jgi:hypothetical protein
MFLQPHYNEYSSGMVSGVYSFVVVQPRFIFGSLGDIFWLPCREPGPSTTNDVMVRQGAHKLGIVVVFNSPSRSYLSK